MEVVHSNKKAATTLKEWLEKARDYETAGDPGAAVDALQNAVKIDPLNEAAYSRLMIIYRKQKKYKEELAIIKKAIAALKDYHNPLTNKPVVSKKISHLSKSIMKMTGLLDKKGKPVYEPEPIGKWSKRKIHVERKLGK